MRRQRFLATAGGEHAVAFAKNSAIRASETLVREIARSEGQMYSGDQPTTDANGAYCRTWHGDKDGAVLVARVAPEVTA